MWMDVFLCSRRSCCFRIFVLPFGPEWWASRVGSSTRKIKIHCNVYFCYVTECYIFVFSILTWILSTEKIIIKDECRFHFDHGNVHHRESRRANRSSVACTSACSRTSEHFVLEASSFCHSNFMDLLVINAAKVIYLQAEEIYRI